ncbi:MAG: anti-sigma factor [Actinomycetia bacterium]|nr:anti-sigma factor [Actinomycetes bacterium]
MDLHELTAAYALDALDAHEAREYEAHLSHCERCRDELSTLAEPATALAWGAEPATPPAALRGRIIEAAAAERANVVPLRRQRLFRATSAAAAVAACAAVGLGLWANSLHRSLHAARSAAASDARAVEILADPAARHIPVTGVHGMVAVDATGQGALMLKQLPAAPPGKTYEAWVIAPGGSPKPAGMFQGGGTMTVVRLQKAVPKGSTVAATMERAGGVDAPTEVPVFSARA